MTFKNYVLLKLPLNHLLANCQSYNIYIFTSKLLLDMLKKNTITLIVLVISYDLSLILQRIEQVIFVKQVYYNKLFEISVIELTFLFGKFRNAILKLLIQWVSKVPG